MKVLILSCNTGQGHNTAGRAVLEELRRQGVPCEMKDVLLFAGRRTSRVVSNAYVKITTRSPLVFQWLYRAGEAIRSDRLRSPVYFANTLYADNLLRYIEEQGFDRVLTPHLFAAEALTSLRRRGKLAARCYGIATDYTCIPFWEETELDTYFIPHRDLAEEFAQKGLPREKLAATGIPVSRRFSHPGDRGAARAALGIGPDSQVCLVMTGSMGFGRAGDYAQALLERGGDRRRVYLFGGRNERLKAELRERFAGEPRAVVLNYTDQVPLYMDGCDLLLTKPGGLTSTEAAVHRIPLIHTAPIPGCETQNAAFFRGRGMSLCPDGPEETAEAAELLLGDPARREAMAAAQAANCNPRAAEEIVRRMAEDDL